MTCRTGRGSAVSLLRLPCGRATAARAEDDVSCVLLQHEVFLRSPVQDRSTPHCAQRQDLLAMLGYATMAPFTVDLLGVPVPTLSITTPTATFELCVCGHDFTAAQHGVQFRLPMDMAVRAFSPGELDRPLVGVREKRRAAESEVRRDLADRLGARRR